MRKNILIILLCFVANVMQAGSTSGTCGAGSMDVSSIGTCKGILNLYIHDIFKECYISSSDCPVVSYDYLQKTIGTTSPTLMCLTTDQQFTDDYTIAEKPGFWLTKEGYKGIYGNNAPWAITCDPATTGVTDGIGFKALQMPLDDYGETTFKGQFFLVNTNNDEYVTVNLTFEISDQRSSWNETQKLDFTIKNTESTGYIWSADRALISAAQLRQYIGT